MPGLSDFFFSALDLGDARKADLAQAQNQYANLLWQRAKILFEAKRAIERSFATDTDGDRHHLLEVLDKAVADASLLAEQALEVRDTITNLSKSLDIPDSETLAFFRQAASPAALFPDHRGNIQGDPLRDLLNMRDYLTLPVVQEPGPDSSAVEASAKPPAQHVHRATLTSSLETGKDTALKDAFLGSKASFDQAAEAHKSALLDMFRPGQSLAQANARDQNLKHARERLDACAQDVKDTASAAGYPDEVVQALVTEGYDKAFGRAGKPGGLSPRLRREAQGEFGDEEMDPSTVQVPEPSSVDLLFL